MNSKSDAGDAANPAVNRDRWTEEALWRDWRERTGIKNRRFFEEFTRDNPFRPRSILLIPFVERCGIYILMNGWIVIYVGQTVNFLQRLGGHLEKAFDHVFFLPYPPECLNAAERYWQKRLRPVLDRLPCDSWPNHLRAHVSNLRKFEKAMRPTLPRNYPARIGSARIYKFDSRGYRQFVVTWYERPRLRNKRTFSKEREAFDFAVAKSFSHSPAH